MSAVELSSNVHTKPVPGWGGETPLSLIFVPVLFPALTRGPKPQKKLWAARLILELSFGSFIVQVCPHWFLVACTIRAGSLLDLRPRPVARRIQHLAGKEPRGQT
jgi:hypothetical protein